jgi:hypothetical protein
MSLLVEIAGSGVVRDNNPVSVFVICVQQENFQAWTVYRRYSQFQLLAEQLLDMYPTIPPLPMFDPTDLSMENLEQCRMSMNKWIQIAGKSILCQFCCFLTCVLVLGRLYFTSIFNF